MNRNSIHSKNVKRIFTACDEMGWVVGLDNAKDVYAFMNEDHDLNPTGLIIGTREYVEMFFPGILIDPQAAEIVRGRDETRVE